MNIRDLLGLQMLAKATYVELQMVSNKTKVELALICQPVLFLQLLLL